MQTSTFVRLMKVMSLFTRKLLSVKSHMPRHVYKTRRGTKSGPLLPLTLWHTRQRWVVRGWRVGWRTSSLSNVKGTISPSTKDPVHQKAVFSPGFHPGDFLVSLRGRGTCISEWERTKLHTRFLTQHCSVTLQPPGNYLPWGLWLLDIFLVHLELSKL